MLDNATCIPFFSGRSALTAILSMEFKKKGFKVAVPSFVCSSVVAAILSAGREPLFIDIKNDMTIDPNDLERKIDKDVVAIIMPHIYGKVCDFQIIRQMARFNRSLLVDDSATCAGLQYGNYKMGLLGDVGIASMNYKTVSSVMGGLLIIPQDSVWYPQILSNNMITKKLSPNSDADIKKLLLSYFFSGLLAKSDIYKYIKKSGLKKTHCFEPVNETIEIASMKNISAILGISQMGKFCCLQKRRERNSNLLVKILGKSKSLSPHIAERKDFFTRFVVKIKNNNFNIKQKLRKINVQYFDTYTPAHILLGIKSMLPMTEEICSKAIVLPNNPVYSLRDIADMGEKILSIDS